MVWVTAVILGKSRESVKEFIILHERLAIIFIHEFLFPFFDNATHAMPR